MLRLLFRVEEVFTIPTRGIVLRPELVPVGQEIFRAGDSLRLVRPDGSEEVAGIGGFASCKGPDGRRQVLVLLKDKSKADVPLGTEVWSAG